MEEHNKAESILESLQGLRKAEAPDFFYTRLLGRMQNEMEPVRKPFLLLRPAFITAALSVVLVVNIFSIMKLDKLPATKAAVQQDKPASIESFAEAYNMNSATVYE